MKINYLFIVLLLCCVASCKILSNKKFEAMNNERDSLNVALSEAEVINIARKKNINRLKADTNRLSTSNRLLNSKVDSLLYQKNKTEKRLNNLDKTYNKYRFRLDEETKKLNRERDSLYKDIEEKQEKIASFEEELAKRRKVIESLQNQLHSISETFKNLEGFNVKVIGDKIHISIADKLLFRKGATNIEKGGKNILKKLSNVLVEFPEVHIRVEGHTDSDKILSIKGIEDNWDLSVMRSTSVVRYMIDVSTINPEILTASGRAEFSPLVPENTEAMKAKNRRIVIILTPKLQELYDIIEGY